MKRKTKIALMIFLVIILLRGLIYRVAIKYSEVGVRQEIELYNVDLLKRINKEVIHGKTSLRKIIDVANEITSEELKFSFNDVSNNPNKIVDDGLANCIGYSSLFNSIVNYLIRKNNLEESIIVKHKVGKLSFLGIDIHKFIKDPFFANHDYNEIYDMKTKSYYFVDPVISDYLFIGRVAQN